MTISVVTRVRTPGRRLFEEFFDPVAFSGSSLVR